MIKIFLLLLLMSCSYKSIVIPNATYLIADHIGDKYDFYYSQEKVFKAALDQTIKESSDELKKLNSHLSEINIQTYDIETDLTFYSPLYFKVTRKMNQILAEIFSQFNESQYKEFFVVLEKDNEIILNRSRRDKTDEMVKRFEFFFDKLSKNQVALIKSNISIFQNINKVRLQNRLISQANLKKAFLIAEPQKKQVEIQKIFDENLKQREPLSNLKKVARFLTTFFKTLDEKQIEFFKKRQVLILEWIQALIEHYK